MDSLNGRNTAFSEHICESCGSGRVEARMHEQRFQYGADSDAVTLEVIVPVWCCENCGLSYTDESAERIRHEAVCAHLGRLAPRQLVSLRKSYGMSQEQFAGLTSIGVASIKRWESGNQIQNASLDKLIRLLEEPDNVERLLGSAKPATAPKFRTTISDTKRRDAAQFRLRIAEVAR